MSLEFYVLKLHFLLPEYFPGLDSYNMLGRLVEDMFEEITST